jgi:hypothetical protein
MGPDPGGTVGINTSVSGLGFNERFRTTWQSRYFVNHRERNCGAIEKITDPFF